MENNGILVTVFTPTYNRAYIIENLYKSLIYQTYKNFEWVIVDDGSSDGTEDLIKEWILENKICIRYYKQENGGKHRAINRGVKLAIGELFFIVDSDDFLSLNALRELNYHYSEVRYDDKYAGVCGVKAFPNGNKVGGENEFTIINCNSMDIVYKYNVFGDLSLAYKTSILIKYSFPDFENEKFCPEGAVWFEIAQKYIIRFFNEKIYICDYLEDGLTKNIIKLRMNSPLGCISAYGQALKNDIPLKYKIKHGISCWRFFFCTKPNYTITNLLNFIGKRYILLILPGYLMHLTDKFITSK